MSPRRHAARWDGLGQTRAVPGGSPGLRRSGTVEKHWSGAEDRGFEPRRAVKPNRISSPMPRLPALSRNDRDCAKSQARTSGKDRISPDLTVNARKVLRVRTRNGHARKYRFRNPVRV